MAKGPEKNTKNKALHTKLLNRKKAKVQEEKREKATRLKALVSMMNQQKKKDDLDDKGTSLQE
jgi:hypothetical protein